MTPLAKPRARVVDRLEIHRDPVDFRTLCERAIRPETRYLVLDLDRTFHFGRNLGELLGFELGAWEVYGAERLAALNARRGPGRFVFDWAHPLAVLRYLFRGARLWLYPGLLYLFMVKLGTRLPLVRPWLYKYFGTDPVEAVQQVPRDALLYQLAEVPMETLRQLARDVWRRHEDDQVILAADLRWLRERCPGIRIIISSASPQPVLEAAAEALDVDAILYTAVEERDGYLSAPYALDRLYLLPRPPRRISPPSRVHVNAGQAKALKLIERFPDFMEPGVETVGITDTSYGEDHAWANFFKTVIDINSPAPFAPVVTAASPLREIHSARVLTRAELASGVLAARGGRLRVPVAEARRLVLHAEDLMRRLGELLPRVETLLQRRDEALAAVGERRAALQARLDALVEAIEREVAAFNASAGRERRAALRRLYRYARSNRQLRKQLARTERELANITYALTRALEASRALLDPDPLAR